MNALKQGNGESNRFNKIHQKREVSRDLCGGRCGTKQRKKVRHLNTNVEDVEVLTTVNPLRDLIYAGVTVSHV